MHSGPSAQASSKDYPLAGTLITYDKRETLKPVHARCYSCLPMNTTQDYSVIRLQSQSDAVRRYADLCCLQCPPWPDVQGTLDHVLCGGLSRQQADLHCDGALLWRGLAGAAAERGQGYDRAEGGHRSGSAHLNCPDTHTPAAHHSQVCTVLLQPSWWCSSILGAHTLHRLGQSSMQTSCMFCRRTLLFCSNHYHTT